MDTKPLSPAQEQAIEKLKEIAGEHFDSFILAIETERNDRPMTNITTMFCKGGYTMAIGLCERAKDVMLAEMNPLTIDLIDEEGEES